MTPILIITLVAIWGIGACYRVFSLVRFYQIEEYKSARFTRSLLQSSERFLPTRPAAGALLGILFQLFLAEGGIFLPTVIGVISSIGAVYPPSNREVKKKFNPTARAKRLLAMSCAIVAASAVLLYIIANRLHPLSETITFAAITAGGFAVFLFAPLWLIISNVLMTPVEALMRRQFINAARKVLEETRPIVIGITGSYGKTTTKSFVAHILNGRFKTYPTPKSYNTLMGICLAINRDLAHDRSIEYFIAEMGAYIPGEIKQIAELTHPSQGILVEIGPQHLERFGSIEKVAIAKYELIEALPPDGAAYFNWDNPHVRAAYERGYPQTRIAVSREIDPQNVPSGGPRFVASEVQETLDGLKFWVTDTENAETIEFTAPIHGIHNVTNLLLATAVAVHEGLSLKEIARRVKILEPAESRLAIQATSEGITIINDAYSANPVGAYSALNTLKLYQGGKRLLITPGMVELGELMASENRRLGEAAASAATDIILVGDEQTRAIQDGLQAAGFPDERWRVVDTLKEAIEWYRSNLNAGDTVLFLNDLPDTYLR